MNCGHSCAEVFRMFEGYYGPYFTPSVDADGNLTWTNNAGLPDPAPINIKGEPGTGLEISGLVATEADLPATAEDWTCYLVGTEVPYTVYTYNPNSGWISLGQLASGPKGDPGAVYTPRVSPEGLLSWTNDGGLPNPEPVNIKGPKGDTGVGVPAGGTPGQVLTKTEDGTAWHDPQGGGGTGNYNELENRPQIGGVTIEGNKTPAQLGLVAAQQGAGLIPDTERQQIGENADDIAELQTDVDAIEAKIPNQASAQNQLADKEFVNSSINSSTAFFRGSFASRAALLAVAWQTSDPSAANYVSNNDYAYVQDDESQNDEAWRYIYVLETGGQNNGWQPQFRVNESPLTAAQVAALNSGATAALIAQITANQTAIGEKYTKPSGGIPASDLAAGVIPTVPTKTSDLTNDSGFVNASGAASAADGEFAGEIAGAQVLNVFVADGTISTVNNGAVAVYEVEPGGTYQVTRDTAAGANQFRLAFGDTAASALAAGASNVGYLDRRSYGETLTITNVWNKAYLYVYYSTDAAHPLPSDVLVVKKYNPRLAHYIDYYNLDANLVTGDSYLSWAGAKVLTNVPITGQTCFLTTKKTLNNIVYQDLWYPTIPARYFRQRQANGTWLSWNELHVDSEDSVSLNYASPIGSKTVGKLYISRAKTVGLSAQDIAVYNGTVFDFIEGQCSVNNGDLIAITNGHGNNAMFGTILHGDYPYLYCPNWVQNDAKIYVNQYSNGAFTLINTISFPTLTGYMNACVDEANQRVYMLVAKTSAELGDIEFVVGDFSGQILSRKDVAALPYIEGMTFFKGAIFVVAGHTGVPSSVSVYNTKGDLLSKTVSVNAPFPLEGIDIDAATGSLYIATTRKVYTDPVWTMTDQIVQAENSGYILAPSSPTSGQFLVYNGSAWTAQTLATWQSGGNY